MPGQSGKRTIFQGRAKQFLLALKKNGKLQTSNLESMFDMKRPNVCACLRALREARYIETQRGTMTGFRRHTYHSITGAGLNFLENQYSEAPEDSGFYVHEKVKKEDGEVNYAEYKRMKAEEQESEMDDLLSEDF